MSAARRSLVIRLCNPTACAREGRGREINPATSTSRRISVSADRSQRPHWSLDCTRQADRVWERDRDGRQHRASEWLLRVGIASELIHQIIGVFLVLALYRLFKAVNETHAKQLVILGALVSVPIVFVNVLNEIAALILVKRRRFPVRVRESPSWMRWRTCSSVCTPTVSTWPPSSGGSGCSRSGCWSSARASFPACSASC